MVKSISTFGIKTPSMIKVYLSYFGLHNCYCCTANLNEACTKKLSGKQICCTIKWFLWKLDNLSHLYLSIEKYYLVIPRLETTKPNLLRVICNCTAGDCLTLFSRGVMVYLQAFQSQLWSKKCLSILFLSYPLLKGGL